jgi:hypothetical protein
MSARALTLRRAKNSFPVYGSKVACTSGLGARVEWGRQMIQQRSIVFAIHSTLDCRLAMNVGVRQYRRRSPKFGKMIA